MASREYPALLRGTIASVVVASVLVAGVETHAQVAPSQEMQFDIPSGSLQSALIAFGSKTGWQLIYAPAAVAGRTVSPLRGRFSARAALERLIANTSLRIRQVSPRVMVLEVIRASPEPAGSAALLAVKVSPARPEAVAEAVPQSLIQDDIVVTGTNIRGEQPVGSHVQTIRKSDMDRNGYATVAQALQAQPGNFGGVATEQSGLSFVDRTGTNATLSTGVNLRGLGAGATLVLVNGRRLAGAGNLGDFADVSNIPTSIVDRIEVLMDGASAIYGSDAVGGVVNIIMKDHFNGLESGARFGTVTSGGMRQIKAYQNAGKDWGTGNILASYEYYEQKPLSAQDRRYSMSADSRAIGGTDHRNIYSLPGNILAYNPSTRSYGSAFAIPTGQNGTALQPEDFLAGQSNYGDQLAGAYLIPQQTRHSVYAALHQDLWDGVRLSIDGRFTRRQFESLGGGYITILTVTPDNPWFVSPTGQSSDLIGYDFGKELGPSRDGGWSQSLGFTGGIDAELPKGWKLAAYASYAQSRERHLTDHIANEAILSEALGTSDDDPATAYSPARDGYFNPYGNGSSNSAAVLAAIGSGYLDARNFGYVTTGNLQLDGPLFDLPAGAVRIAVGTNIRREVFDTQYTAYYYTTAPEADPSIHYGRTIEAAFAEARITLFGPANAVAGFRRLDLSLAGRIEKYPDFGSTSNPKVGVNWSPVAGLTFRGTYGSSFRAPNLNQLRNEVGVITTSLVNPAGASVRVLYLGGGNPDLRPEKARSWTVGADAEPAFLPGLRINGTLFRTVFDNRIDRPIARDFRNALTNPDLAPFVRFVSPVSNSADRAYLNALIASFGASGRTYPVDQIAAVVDARYVNTASVDVRGMDISAAYNLRHGADTFSVHFNGTYLFAWRQRTTPSSIPIDQRNRAGQPVDFRGRLTAGWQRCGFDTLAGINFVDGYRNPLTGAHIGSWTTVDARIAWSAPKNSPVSGITLALVAQNIFDRDPPFYDSSAGVGYDAANSDATGRFISFQITKRW